MVRFLTTQTLALAMLVAPLFGGNDKNFTYLALGDSIAFGFDPTLMPSQPPFPAPDKFILGSGAFWPPERLPNAVLTGLGCML